MTLIFMGELLSKLLIYRLAIKKLLALPPLIFTLLLLDVLFLSGYLYFIGGATNALISLLLLPIAISAILLNQQQTWLIAATALICYTLLMTFNLPLTFDTANGHQHGMTQDSHYWAMWGTFFISTLVLTTFVLSMAQAIKERDSNIANYREEQLRSEQVVALGTMAASAAHELATPLSTMQLISDDFECIDNSDERAAQMALMQQQLTRCHDILAQLRHNTTQLKDNKHISVNAKLFFNEVIDTWSVVRPDISYDVDINQLNQQHIKTHATLASAIMNLLNNAADASLEQQKNQIEISFTLCQQQTMIEMSIRHYGNKVNIELQNQLGNIAVSNKKNGMGIGVFLANASIEKLHGQVTLSNLDYGVLTRVYLPVIENS
ncbi:MAG: HAMP domain-containing histidine kinase [Psychrobium sp.]|nr:HAMP domain-containing histidine kinase [Psychrobium sp.]